MYVRILQVHECTLHKWPVRTYVHILPFHFYTTARQVVKPLQYQPASSVTTDHARSHNSTLIHLHPTKPEAKGGGGGRGAPHDVVLLLLRSHQVRVTLHTQLQVQDAGVVEPRDSII